MVAIRTLAVGKFTGIVVHLRTGTVSSMVKKRGSEGTDTRRVLSWSCTVVSIGVLATVDGVLAIAVAASLGAVYSAIRWRGPRRLRKVMVIASLVVAMGGLVGGLALPTYAQRSAPLIVNLTPSGRAVTSAPLTARRSDFEILGYVASDYEDSNAGVDGDVARVTTLAPTGIALGRRPGTLEVSDASDTLVRAHAAGTRALAVVSNFDGTIFNGERVRELVASPPARRLFISALTKLVAQQGWDGVVLDFENLPPTVRKRYPAMIRDLDEALGARIVDVAVPSFTDPSDPDLVGYDLGALARVSDHITWMAYDEHELGTGPGPIASLPWVSKSLDVALRSIPADKLLLGVASYGYAWSSPRHAIEYSARESAKLAAAPGAQRLWDARSGEWRVHLPDGRTLWYADGRSIAAGASIALQRHLGGIALWRVGADEPTALDQLPLAARRTTPTVAIASAGARPIEDVHARGVVALTFDDGPDPRWTPAILDILRRAHVPATFFVIGQEAQKHPGLVREAMRDGNVVGNHTYSHKDLSHVGRLQAEAEIAGGAAVIEGITGRHPVLFRSPFGAGDTSSHKVGADQLANDLGEHAVAWNVDPLDWSTPGTAAIEARVASRIQERSIVLLHDGGGNRSETITALPAIIDHLKAQHYLFTTVDGLDGSIRTPYVERRGRASELRGLMIIATFRLWVALRRAFIVALSAIAGLSILRLVWTVPLAILESRRHRRWMRERAAQPTRPAGLAWPTVTIAVPAHNEATVIAKTVAALQQLRHPGGPESLEILVVDDGSTDATAVQAEMQAARCPDVCVRVLSQPASKKAGALNRAFAEARGDVVIVIDADTLVDPGLLEAVLPHFDDPAVGAVAGNVKVGNQRSVLGKLQAIEYLVALDLDRRAQAFANVVAVVPGAAGAFRRSAVLEAGGYSTDTLVEDADLTVTLLERGWRIDYEPDAIAHTEAPQTVRDVMRQRRRWSYGTVEVIAKHRAELLRRRAGRVGLLGLPWMLLSQVVLPLAGPSTDAFLLYLLVVHNLSEAVGIIGIAAAADLVVCALTVLANREPKGLLAYVPLLRLFWRPLQLAAIAASALRWVGGRPDGWRKVTRYGSVDLRLVAHPSVTDAAGSPA